MVFWGIRYPLKPFLQFAQKTQQLPLENGRWKKKLLLIYIIYTVAVFFQFSAVLIVIF